MLLRPKDGMGNMELLFPLFVFSGSNDIRQIITPKTVVITTVNDPYCYLHKIRWARRFSSCSSRKMGSIAFRIKHNVLHTQYEGRI